MRGTNVKTPVQSAEKTTFRLLKPGQYSGNKSPIVTKKQSERKPEKNTVIQDYRQYIDTLRLGESREPSPEPIEKIPCI